MVCFEYFYVKHNSRKKEIILSVMNRKLVFSKFPTLKGRNDQ